MDPQQLHKIQKSLESNLPVIPPAKIMYTTFQFLE